MIGGPIVGVASGLLIGGDMIIMGGEIQCILSPILSGLAGGILWMAVGKKYPKISVAVLGIAIIISLEIMIMFLDVSKAEYANAITYGFFMICANLVSMILFSASYLRYTRHQSYE